MEDRGEECGGRNFRQFTFASPTERSSYRLDDDRITRMIVGPHDVEMLSEGPRRVVVVFQCCVYDLRSNIQLEIAPSYPEVASMPMSLRFRLTCQ